MRPTNSTSSEAIQYHYCDHGDDKDRWLNGCEWDCADGHGGCDHVHLCDYAHDHADDHAGDYAADRVDDCYCPLMVVGMSMLCQTPGWWSDQCQTIYSSQSRC